MFTVPLIGAELTAILNSGFKLAFPCNNMLYEVLVCFALNGCVKIFSGRGGGVGAENEV